LVVSSGMVEVPDVTGKSAKEACEILEGDDYQLGCKTEEVETADEPAKKVFEQSSSGGSEVKQGTEITVKVAKKPPEEPSSPSIPSIPGGIPTSPSDDGGSDDEGNDTGGNGGNDNGGNDDNKDDDSSMGPGDVGGLFDGFSDAS
ncbi:PASTA domain-containing protein, partial [Brevibacterium aurantiacum]